MGDLRPTSLQELSLWRHRCGAEAFKGSGDGEGGEYLGEAEISKGHKA